RIIDIILQEINEYYWNLKITSELLELRNLAMVAKLIIECSCARKESRGLHFNLDYPGRDDSDTPKDTIITKAILRGLKKNT
ncbi:MAG: L-aspartate oxidase, partial [Syntrophales bacterium]|nr:L-aspartate oxidase [Syntrophales bacterium]